MHFQKGIFTTKTLNRAAILIAMSVVFKSFLSIEGGVFRISFFDIPLIVLGIMLGPVIAIISGFVVDWIYVLTSPFAFTFNFMTLSTIAWALIPALFLFRRKNISIFILSIVIILTSIIAFSLNTYQLYIWYGTGAFGDLPVRIVIMLVKLPIQISLINILYKRVLSHDEILIEER